MVVITERCTLYIRLDVDNGWVRDDNSFDWWSLRVSVLAYHCAADVDLSLYLHGRLGYRQRLRSL